MLLLAALLLDGLEPHGADLLDLAREALGDTVGLLVEVVVDESHALHGREDAVVELALVVGELDGLALVFGLVDLREQLALVEPGCEFRHLAFGDLAVLLHHHLEEQLADDLLLLGREDDLEDVVGKIEDIEQDNHGLTLALVSVALAAALTHAGLLLVLLSSWISQAF